MRRVIDYKQVGALALLGAGTYALKQMSHKDHGSNRLFEQTHYLRRHSNLAKILTNLEQLEQPQTLQKLVIGVEKILQLSYYISSNAGSVQMKQYAVKMNDFMQIAMQTAEMLTDDAKRSRDPRVDMACVDCVQEDLPAMAAIFESILHNAMLDCQTT